MARARILIVEDDPRLAATLERVLQTEAHDVEIAPDGNDALRRARERSFDLVVLDIMLPGVDGISVCKRLRATGPIPILLLTALGGTASTPAPTTTWSSLSPTTSCWPVPAPCSAVRRLCTGLVSPTSGSSPKVTARGAATAPSI
jgi:hypothetical protein